MIFEYIFSIVYLFLPFGISNMVPVFFKKINFLNFPIDFNKKINGKEIFGKNKTYRGFFFGILFSILVIVLQTYLYSNTIFFNEISLLNYESYNSIYLGLIFGFSSLFGDLFFSFFKRRLNIKSGKTWIFFDQVDWILGSFLVIIFFTSLELKDYIVILLLFGTLHPIINYIGYLMKIKKNKF